MQAVIQVQNLKKTYPLAKAKDGVKTMEALKGTSFAVAKGEIFGILGIDPVLIIN